jgi:exosortase
VKTIRLRVALVSGVLLSILIISLYAHTTWKLFEDWWTRDEASYGMLIPPIAAYIAYARRRSTFGIPARLDARGLLGIAAACLLFLVGKLGAEFFLSRLSLVVLLGGLAWTFWGLPRTRSLAFPLLLLATMVPLPVLIYNSLAFPLQLVASEASASIIRFFGESVYRDGNVLQLAHTTLGVAEACSGLHSLASLVVASLILSFVECTRTWTRFLVVALSIPMAIGMNVLRVTGTAFLADIDQRYAEGFYHSFSGWVIFVAGLGLLWVLAKALRIVAERIL